MIEASDRDRLSTMPPHRPAILITGFGPFPGVPVNASATLARRLGAVAARRFPRKRIVTEVIATEWAAAPRQIARLYAVEQPVLAVHFGVSREAKGFVIETVARNACRPSADAAGKAPESSVVSACDPDVLPTALPAQNIVERLRALAIPAIESTDAGGYLCNTVMFHALCQARAMPQPARAGFIHIPADIPDAGDDGVFDWPMALAGGLEILRTCLALTAPSSVPAIG